MAGGILETFFILFQTDADKATHDLGDLDRAADKAEHGLRKVDAAAHGLGRSFVNMAQSFAAPLLALASVGSLASLAVSRIGAIDDIADEAGKLRSSAQDYDAFTRAVQATGGSLVAAQGDLTTFSTKLNDAAARPDGPNAKNFAKWGIKFKDIKGEAVGAVDGVLALAKSLEEVDQAEAIGRLKRLGITDADTISFLMQGKAAIVEKMNAEKRAGVVTEEQIRIVGEYQEEIGKTRNILDTFANGLTEYVVPAMTASLGVFRRVFGWLMDNKTLVTGFFIGLSAAITYMYLPAVYAALAATATLLAPYLAIGAAIAAIGAAFALAYEDWRYFMDGQPSLLGSLAEKYKWFGDAVKLIGEGFKGAWANAKETFDAIAEGFAGALKNAGGVGEALGEGFKGAWANAEETFNSIKNGLASIGVDGPLLQEGLEGAGKNAEETFKLLREGFAGSVENAREVGAALATGLRAALSEDSIGKLREGLQGAGRNAVDTFTLIRDGIAGAGRNAGETAGLISEGFRGAWRNAQEVFDLLRKAAQDFADLVGKAFTSAGDAVISIWNSVKSAITGVIEAAVGGLRTLLSFSGSTVNIGVAVGTVGAPPVANAAPGSPEAAANVANGGATIGDIGGRLLRNASSTPLGAVPAGAVNGGPVDNSKHSTVTVGTVNVQTQATDAKGVAAGVRDALGSQLRNANASFDNGVDR